MPKVPRRTIIGHCTPHGRPAMVYKRQILFALFAAYSSLVATDLAGLAPTSTSSGPGCAFAQESLLQSFMDKGEEAQKKGHYFEAKKQYEAAVLAAEKLNENDPNLENALTHLARLDTKLGAYDDAEGFWKRLLAMKEKSAGKDSMQTAAILMQLSLVNRYQRRYAEAETIAERALEIAKTKGAGKAMVPYLINLSSIYLDRNRFDAAENMAKAAITNFDKADGASPQLADALSALANIYAAQGKTDDAEKFSQRAIAIREAASGKESAATADDRIRLASLLSQQGKYDEAEKLLAPLLNTQSVNNKISDDVRLRIARALAAILLEQEKTKDAIPLLEQAINLATRTMGSASTTYAAVATELGLAYMEAQNYVQAEANLKKALNTDEQILGKDSAGIAPDLNNIGLLYLKQGKYDFAESLYKRALELCQKSLGDNHLDVAACYNNLGFVERNKGDYKDAEQLVRKGLAIREKVLGPNHALVAQNLVILADVVKPQGRTDEAIELLSRAIVIKKSQKGDNTVEVTGIERELADALLSAKKYPEAIEKYREVIKAEQVLGGTDNGALASDMANLAEALRARGETAESNELRKKADRLKATLPGYNSTDVSTISEDANISQPPRPIRDKWALVVGISNFKDTSINLKYAAKDATDFKNYLITEADFAPDHVKLLTDAQATRENIVGNLGEKWLARVAGPDDLVVLYMSSHGSAPDKNVNANFIVTYEGTKENLVFSGIPMQWLTVGIQEVLHADRTVLLLDVCHGGAISGAKALKREFEFVPSAINVGPGQLILVSSMDDQISWESKRYHNGVFTHYLLEGLRRDGNRSKMGDVFHYLKDKVEEEVLRDRAFLQTPMMFKKIVGGTDIVLSDPGTSPRRGIVESAPAPSSAAASDGARKTIGKKTITPASSAAPGRKSVGEKPKAPLKPSVSGVKKK